MTSISHVTHIDNSLEILQLGQIRPQQVYDHSILREDGVMVNWLSPNGWANGYRYGNVCFSFDFASLVANKRYYWVEVVNYSPRALRILITDQDHSSDSRLLPYDPKVGNGPWWHDAANRIHYRNGHHTLEFMFEHEIQIDLARSISIVKHHDSFCCINSNSCLDKGKTSQGAGPIFAAGVALQGIDCRKLPFDTNSDTFTGKLWMDFHHWNNLSCSPDVRNEASDDALANEWLNACFCRDTSTRQAIRDRFPSKERFFDAIKMRLASCFSNDALGGILQA